MRLPLRSSLRVVCAVITAVLSMASSGCNRAREGSSDGGVLAGCNECAGSVYHGCDRLGQTLPPEDCAPRSCINGKGCVDCSPGARACDANKVVLCGAGGEFSEPVETCPDGCYNGQCGSSCEIAALEPS